MSDQADAVTLSDLADAIGADAPDNEELEDGATDDDQQHAQGSTEDDDQGDGQDDTANGDDDGQDQGQKFKVVVKNAEGQDEEKELSLEELAQGYMLQADYTRKTQAAAQERSQLQQQFQQEVANTHQAAIDSIGQLQQMVIAHVAPELQNVNWATLAGQDPAEYVRLQAMQQQVQQTLQLLESQKQQHAHQAQQAEQQQRDQAIRQSAQYLEQSIPGFNAVKYRETLEGGNKHYGFSPQELNSVVDGRMVHVLHDALQWRALQAQKPKAMQKVAAAPKVIRPAAPQPRNRNQEAVKRLRQSGRVSDLAALIPD